MANPPQTPAEERRFEANSLTIAATAYAGSGPPLILLHGIGSRGVSWWPVVDRLAERFSPLAVDLRGHGASGKPAAGYLLPDYAADLAAVIDVLGLKHPLIIGHSLGGLVALTWAKDHPDRAAGIVVEDTALRRGPDFVPTFDHWLALNAMSPREVAENYAREYPHWSAADCERRAESICSTARGVFAELRAQTMVDAGTDLIAAFGCVQSPMLFVHGDTDSGGMVAQADAERFGTTLPNAQVNRIPGGNHNLHRDYADEFLALVIPFLDRAMGYWAWGMGSRAW